MDDGSLWPVVPELLYFFFQTFTVFISLTRDSKRAGDEK